jgi:acetyl-CoA carboxylase biotin carboxyl carrier protein
VELNTDDIQEILRIFAESDLEELQLDIGGTRLHVSKSSHGGSFPISTPAAGVQSAPAAPPADPRPTGPADRTASERGSGAAGGGMSAALADDPDVLKSPLVGVFYRRPAPDQPPFVEIGSEVDPKDPVCIVDVMKMFTRVPAGIAGRVAEIYVEDGQLIEFGQPLMRFEPR